MSRLSTDILKFTGNNGEKPEILRDVQARVIASERGCIDVQFEPKVETLRIPQPGSSVGLVHSNFGIIAYTVCVVGLNPSLLYRENMQLTVLSGNFR